jgi:hypothetical protein
MNLDDVVASLEENAKKVLMARAKAWLLGKIPWAFSGIGGVVGIIVMPLIGLFIDEVVIKNLDLAGYYVLKSQVNRHDAETYQDSKRVTDAAVERGDLDAIAKAEAAQEAAFIKLGLLSA